MHTVHVITWNGTHLFAQKHNGTKVVGENNIFQKLCKDSAEDQRSQYSNKIISSKKKYINKQLNPNQTIAQISPCTKYVIEGRTVVTVDDEKGIFFSIQKEKNSNHQ